MILLRRRAVLLTLAAVALGRGPTSFAAETVVECSSAPPPSDVGSSPSSSAAARARLAISNGGIGLQRDAPFVRPRELIGGRAGDAPLGDDGGGDTDGGATDTAVAMEFADVYGCCGIETAGPERADGSAALLRPALIGRVPQYTASRSLSALDSAAKAWDGGSGAWPQMSLSDRIVAVERFLDELRSVREEMVHTLMWEIGKNRPDAESEFDRTVSFVRQCISVLRDPEGGEYNSKWESVGAVRAFIRRGPIGVILCLGPYNYPLNETYAALIPALLMGNVVLMKVPTVGGLVHSLAMDAFAKSFPPGSVNFISGGGRATMPPLMETGKVDGLAFIGGSAAADDLILKHPEPHRLKTFLQLEAKNMAVFLPDVFSGGNEERLERAADEAVAGALGYNGQRCTALKILFVPRSHGERFAKMVAERVERMRVGLPWQTFERDDHGGGDGGGKGLYSQITPLPNQKRVQYMRRLINDAVSKGAEVINSDGGQIVGGNNESTLMIPAVVFPCTPSMDIYQEEQFGPVVPIAEYDDLETVLSYAREGKYGQQASIFTTEDGTDDAAKLVDRFSPVFGKININGQCGRSPDTLPFSGRRSSAMGVMSVTEALREFSVPTVVAYKARDGEAAIAKEIQGQSRFMADL